MLSQLVAFGLFGSGGSSGGGGVIGPITDTGAVIASPERTATALAVQSMSLISLGFPLGALSWRQHYDPADRAPYALDFGALLDGGETIVEIEAIFMNATAALLGVSVDVASGYGPIIDNGGEKVQIWFAVNQAAWDAIAFEAGGVLLPVTIRVETSSTPPKRYERTGIITVRQQ